MERADSVVPCVIAGSSSLLWLYAYRRFNHAFHLDNLPLKHLKAVKKSIFIMKDM